MNATIWKFEFPWPPDREVFTVVMPKGAEILSVGNQFERPVCWARVDPLAELEDRFFAVCGTGLGSPAASDSTYLGTVQFAGGSLILHYFAALPA